MSYLNSLMFEVLNNELNGSFPNNAIAVFSFDNPSETETFLLQYGYPVETKVIDGGEFLDRLEFGYSDCN